MTATAAPSPEPEPPAPAPEPSPEPTTPAPEPSPEPTTPAPEPSPEPTTPAPEPTTDPATPTTDPTTDPATATTDPTTDPATPTTDPATPTTDPTTDPATPTTDPTTDPATPTTDPTTPTTDPAPPTPEETAVETDRIPAGVVDNAPPPPAPPTPQETAVETDRIPAAIVPPAADPGDGRSGGGDFGGGGSGGSGLDGPDGAGLDGTGLDGSGLDGSGLDALGIGDTLSGSADISSTDPTAADFGEAFLDPAIPAAGVGVVDQTGGSDPLGDLAREIVEAAGDALAAVARLWADPPSPGIGTIGADGIATPSEATGLLTGSLAWYTGAIAVLAVLVAAGRMVWMRRTQPLAELLRGLGTLVLVSGAGLTGVILLVSASDAFSGWILEQATGDVEAGLTDLLALQRTEELSVVLSVLVGTATLLAAVVQVVLLVARGVVLVVLAGVLPLTASATNTDTGRAVFVRTLTWTVAFALYQPAAALVYAAAFLTPLPEDSPLVAALTGTTFLLLAIAALPVMLRVLRPMVRTVAASSRVRAAGAHGLPTGARAVAPVTVATGAGGGAASVRVPSARGAAPRHAAGTLPRDARVGAARLGVAGPVVDAFPGLGRKPEREAIRARVARAGAATEIAPIPTQRPDREDSDS
ncbi:hypothetical protein [Geodermatophilus sp. CPCC 205506]|uniref:hypothetical protein n=1 Tax=Geodermatophilus sp. CPCC 205506 TaxID=2936596 RepID=UPI003EED6748